MKVKAAVPLAEDIVGCHGMLKGEFVGPVNLETESEALLAGFLRTVTELRFRVRDGQIKDGRPHPPRLWVEGWTEVVRKEDMQRYEELTQQDQALLG